MKKNIAQKFEPEIKVERLSEFQGNDLSDLCDAMEKTIEDGLGFSIGFGWLKAPERERVEKYWKGLMLVPDRVIFVGRIDGVIAASIQLIKPSANNQSQSFAGSVREHFVAPWARGHGLAKMLVEVAEEEAKNAGLKILKLEVRATQDAAAKIYESQGFKKWGELDKYEFVDGNYVAGYFYYKDLL
jgi:ribosomal protein S18 acetylase RimI-like enzyme